MDLILTSFGVSHLPRREQEHCDIFFRMPPGILGRTGHDFFPDYAALLVADRVVVDRTTYELLMSGQHHSYGSVAVMVKTLYDEGFVRLEDFDSIIARKRDLLETMLERDLQEPDSWVMPLKQAAEEWRRFVAGFQGFLGSDYVAGRLQDWVGDESFNDAFYDVVAWTHTGAIYSPAAHLLLNEALDSSPNRHDLEHRRILRVCLSGYLSYVNANLLLANELGGGIYDWSDLRPFYRDKFLRVARSAAPGEREVECIRELFKVSFPELTCWTPSSIVRAFKDKRIVELRKMVESAARGDVTFDREFANRTLWEVLRIERSIGRLRNLVSYATLPLGLIPWVGSVTPKAVEEAIVQPIARKRKSEYGWFYLISELAEGTQREATR